MLIIALVLAVIGLAALVFAVVTSNALVAWVCIGASALGVLLLTVDALRDRNRQRSTPAEPSDEAEPAPETDAADTDVAGVETEQQPDDEEPAEQPAEAAADDADDADDEEDQESE